MPGIYQKHRERILACEHKNREEGRLPYWNDRARSINWKAAKRYCIYETVTGEQLMALYQSSSCCLYCGENLAPGQTHIDHMIPIAHDGANTIENSCIACSECNFSKNDDSIEKFIQRVEETGEPEKASAWVIEHRQEIQIVIDNVLMKGVRENEFDFSDYI